MRITPPHRNRNGISSRWDMKPDQDPHRISQFDGGGPEADDLVTVTQLFRGEVSRQITA